jgi:hypothetical protein
MMVQIQSSQLRLMTLVVQLEEYQLEKHSN